MCDHIQMAASHLSPHALASCLIVVAIVKTDVYDLLTTQKPSASDHLESCAGSTSPLQLVSARLSRDGARSGPAGMRNAHSTERRHDNNSGLIAGIKLCAGKTAAVIVYRGRARMCHFLDEANKKSRKICARLRNLRGMCKLIRDQFFTWLQLASG